MELHIEQVPVLIIYMLFPCQGFSSAPLTTCTKCLGGLWCQGFGIKQGPELEAEGLQLGIVTAIAAPAALRISFSGDGGHAGAQLMPLRCAPEQARWPLPCSSPCQQMHSWNRFVPRAGVLRHYFAARCPERTSLPCCPDSLRCC